MDELEGKFEDLEKELQQMNNNQEMLNRNYNELIELKFVLAKDDDFFREAHDFDELSSPHGLPGEDESIPLTERSTDPSGTGSMVKLGFITGVISREKFAIFERILFRATRGNLFMKYVEIEERIKDPQTGDQVSKNVFIVFFQGERLQSKIKKICEAFGANIYPCPETAKERQELSDQVRTRLDDLQVVLDRTLEHRRQVLSTVAAHLESWKEKVMKEKAIYHTMNMFNYDTGHKCLIAEGWCPISATEQIQTALRKAIIPSNAIPSIMSVVTTKHQPPTYFKTNKFTSSFQAIVDAYGVARYGEVNPTVFTIVTFPFLFGVMFGDIGHGILLLLFALYMIWKEKEWSGTKLNELLETAFVGRYVLLLMGVFAIYAGIMYNEFLAIPIDPWGTKWERAENGFVPISFDKSYPLGVDPVWKGNPSELLYYNSLKMKMSIILGVLQMCVGISMKLLNGLHFKNDLDIFFEFIPQIVFMLSIFGYMCFLIFYKWLAVPWAYYDAHNSTVIVDGPCMYEKGGTGTAPMLLNVMIFMVLGVFSRDEYKCLFKGQFEIQLILILVALISVPVMLIPKPLIMKRRHERKAFFAHDNERPPEHDEHEEEEFQFGEILVHQIIETIEFVLGSISNTASYLRLWALSLAHSELATVFWKMLIVQVGVHIAKEDSPSSQAIAPVFLFVTVSAWLVFTVGVILIMESLSAFLHALRLHWVEFQNKFYKGDGVKFSPFSYEKILSGETDD